MWEEYFRSIRFARGSGHLGQDIGTVVVGDGKRIDAGTCDGESGLLGCSDELCCHTFVVAAQGLRAGCNVCERVAADRVASSGGTSSGNVLDEGVDQQVSQGCACGAAGSCRGCGVCGLGLGSGTGSHDSGGSGDQVGENKVLLGPKGGVSVGRGPNYERNKADRRRKELTRREEAVSRRHKLEKEWFCLDCVDGERCSRCEFRRDYDVWRKRQTMVSADAELKETAKVFGSEKRIGRGGFVPSDRCTSCVSEKDRCEVCELRRSYVAEKTRADLEQLRIAQKNGTYLWRENRPVGQSRVERFASQRVRTVCSGPNTRPNSAMSSGSGGSDSIFPGSSASQSGGTPASSVTQRSAEDELLIAGLKEQLETSRKNEEAMSKRLNESDASSEVIRQLRRENRAKSDRIDNLTRRLQK